MKRSKDAAATATMKQGGWDTAKSYRDLIKNKDEAVSLEQKSRVVKDVDMIDDSWPRSSRSTSSSPKTSKSCAALPCSTKRSR